ncbi:EF-hand domain-containing protein [Streptomyces sp. NPDC001091]
MTVAPQIDLLDRKFDMCFGHADQNNDGVVDAADILTFAARVIAAFGEPFDSPKATGMLRACQNWWEGMVAELDTDKDGKIDPQEYRVGMRRIVGSPSAFDAASRPVAVASILTWTSTSRRASCEPAAASSRPAGRAVWSAGPSSGTRNWKPPSPSRSSPDRPRTGGRCETARSRPTGR